MTTRTVLRRSLAFLAAAALLLGTLGLVLPSRPRIPVAGATEADWNRDTFWHHPWGRSGVHKGIDIFAPKGTPVLAAVSGMVVFSTEVQGGGRIMGILGPKWRVHYYAHLDSCCKQRGEFVAKGDTVGFVGTTGNAVGKPPHLHYSIVTLLPYPWRWSRDPQGWKRMLYLNPHSQLTSGS